MLCASYSGDTEETLACFEAAGVLGARRIVATTGGALAAGGARRGRAGDPDGRRAAAPRRGRLPDRRRARGRRALRRGPEAHDRDRRRRRPPRAARGRVGPGRAPRRARPRRSPARCTAPCPSSPAPGSRRPIAYRWKTQVNENAKQHAFASELPECDHNEIVGWPSAPDFGRFSAVFLDDSDDTPRVEQRIRLTREIIGDAAAALARRRQRAARRRSSAPSRSCSSATSCRSTSAC